MLSVSFSLSNLAEWTPMTTSSLGYFFSSLARSGMTWMQLMQQSVQKSRRTILPRRSFMRERAGGVQPGDAAVEFRGRRAGGRLRAAAAERAGREPGVGRPTTSRPRQRRPRPRRGPGRPGTGGGAGGRGAGPGGVMASPRRGAGRRAGTSYPGRSRAEHAPRLERDTLPAGRRPFSAPAAALGRRPGGRRTAPAGMVARAGPATRRRSGKSDWNPANVR